MRRAARCANAHVQATADAAGALCSDVRQVRRPLDSAIDRVGLVQHEVGERSAVFDEGRPTQDATAIERVIGREVPTEEALMREAQPRGTSGEQCFLGIERVAAWDELEL